MKQKSQALKQELVSLIRKIEEQQFACPFREPVDPQDAPDYFEVITNPIDLRAMTQRVRQDQSKNKHMLYLDLMLMVENWKSYTGKWVCLHAVRRGFGRVCTVFVS